MDRTDYHTFAANGWRGRVHRAWSKSLSGGDPLEALLRWPNELIHERETARTWRVETGETVLYAKQERSELAGPRRQWERALKMLLGPSPARRTLGMSLRMARCGVGVPRVVLAARRRVGLRGVEDLLVTERAPGTVLSRLMNEAPSGNRSAEIVELVGRRVAELHRHGFTHGHLLHGHVFVEADRGEVIFIDNDETRRWWRRPPARRRRQNLEQLTLLARGRWGYALTRRWLNSYFDASGMSGRRRRRMHRRVLLAVRARHRRRLERRRDAERTAIVSA